MWEPKGNAALGLQGEAYSWPYLTVILLSNAWLDALVGSVPSVFISGKVFSYQYVKLTLSSQTEYGVPVRLASD